MLAAADARRTAASGKNTVCSVKNRAQYTIYGLSTEYGDTLWRIGFPRGKPMQWNKARRNGMIHKISCNN